MRLRNGMHFWSSSTDRVLRHFSNIAYRHGFQVVCSGECNLSDTPGKNLDSFLQKESIDNGTMTSSNLTVPIHNIPFNKKAFHSGVLSQPMNTTRRLHVNGGIQRWLHLLQTLDAAVSVIPKLPDSRFIKKTAGSEHEV
jgi:hypothetical protein